MLSRPLHCYIHVHPHAHDGGPAVAAGAIGAHGLKDKPEKERADWKTATQYQLAHSLALAILPLYQKSHARSVTGALFTSGILLFSGSIYAYVWTNNVKVTGAAPVGGMALIAGWLSLALLKR
jgi:uncharacterized membrane protein YgdD (TMEM256/DUF423 family)